MVADCHLAFLHCFKQRALHFRRSAVDFVGQHEVGEDRAFLYLELLVLYRVDHCAEHVGREQVGSELYAAVFGIDQLSQSFDGKGFGQARHAFEKNVAVGEHGCEKRFHQMFLAHDGLVHASGDHCDEVAFGGHQFVELPDVDAVAHKRVYSVRGS